MIERAAIAPATRVHQPPFEILRFTRQERVQPALDELLATCDRRAHITRDPIELVYRYERSDDREIVGLLASSVAYGRVDLFKPRLAALLPRFGPSPSAFARDASPKEILGATADFTYRMTGPGDIGALLAAGGRAQSRFGSLGALAGRCFEEADGSMRGALDRWVATLWQIDLKPFIGQTKLSRRLAHLVASPGGTSACKRLNLYARWMVRGPDGVDFGLWPLPASALVIPLDTHVHRISRFLGLTRRTDLSWKTAEDITARLRHLDPADPVKYDFALSHLGISGDCPSRQDLVKCGRCPLRPICKVWDRAAKS